MTPIRVLPRAATALLAAAWVTACEPASAPEVRIIDRIELQGPAAPVIAGFSVQMYALVFDTKNKQMPDADVEWESSNPLVAPVDEFGFFVTQRPGTATITATTAEKSATYNLTVIGTPCHQWATLGASITAPGSVAGSVAGTDCIFAGGWPSKGHAITITAPTTLSIQVQGAGFIPVLAVASSTWDLSYGAETGTAVGDSLRRVVTLPAGNFIIWVASASNNNASYTLTTTVMSACGEAAIVGTLAPGDSLGGALGPTSCWRNGLLQTETWRVIAAPDEEIVIDAYGVGGSPELALSPSPNFIIASAAGNGAPSATLGYFSQVADTLELWVSMQHNAHAAFSIRRRVSQLPTCLTPGDTIAVGDTVQRLMFYGDCERGLSGVRMHTYLLALDTASTLDIRMSGIFSRLGFAVRTLGGAPLHLAGFDEALNLARARVALAAGQYLLTANGSIGLYTLSVVADTLP